ncbi:MAG: rubrerythrin family protein, partial [Phycisphaerae bacterium]|nr:rubrerythrin family protein [Phycisphaerae bacterium]
MHEMTAGNLRSAFGGESMAHMRYKIWAAKATSDGFASVSRLFRALSCAEQAHATGHFNALADVAGTFLVPSGGGFGFGSTSDNLAEAIAGETFEIDEMYPAYDAVARIQENASARTSIRYALAAETDH